jgi:hypothetical protein
MDIVDKLRALPPRDVCEHGSQRVKCPICEVIAWEQRAAHIARRLRYLADCVPNDELTTELHALAREMEDAI